MGDFDSDAFDVAAFSEDAFDFDGSAPVAAEPAARVAVAFGGDYSNPTVAATVQN